MVNILLWTITGICTGIISTYIFRSLFSQHTWKYIFVGVIGALDGGFTLDLFGLRRWEKFDMGSLVFVFVFSCFVLFLVRKLQTVHRANS